VVGGYIRVDSALVSALFDPSASHSFISVDLVKTIERVKCPTRKPLLVQTTLERYRKIRFARISIW